MSFGHLSFSEAPEPPARIKGGSRPHFNRAHRSEPIRSANVRLLIVNDNGELRRLVASYLESENMDVSALAESEGICRRLEEVAPSAILLYRPENGDHGLDLLREIRSFSDVPVIMITGHASDEADRVVGLELGADDYLTTPFGFRELGARVRALLRRTALRQETSQSDSKCIVYRFGGWQLHQRTRRLVNPQGVPISLTKGEYALLIAFVRAPGRPLSREQLISATRANDDVFDRSVDVQVYRLRCKLQPDREAASIIQTDRGVGYRFEASVEQIAFG